jgi:phage internal scaffolding protein
MKKPNNIYYRKAVQYKSNMPSKTQQDQAAGVEINLIMARYLKTGELTHIKENPRYGDFSNITNYQDALDNVFEAQEDFAKLPSKLRDMFNNEPAHLLEFLSDPKNKEQAQELGLIAKPIKNEPEASQTTPSKPTETLSSEAPQGDVKL